MDSMHSQNNGVLRKCYTGITTGVPSKAIMKNVCGYPRLGGPFSSVVYMYEQLLKYWNEAGKIYNGELLYA